MEERQLDFKAVELSIAKVMQEAIIGIFGDKNEVAMINKLHAMIEFADHLNLKELSIKVSLASLRKAKIEFETDEEIEKHDE
tara:strand:+ start:224 stop:469 length:246 start_codon:yes stop_codon:yes gene_type:complete